MIKFEEIEPLCDILGIQIHIYSANLIDPEGDYICEKYGKSGNVVQLWLNEQHYQLILEL